MHDRRSKNNREDIGREKDSMKGEGREGREDNRVKEGA